MSIAVSGPAVLLNYPRMFFSSEARQWMGFQPEYAPNLRGLVSVLGAHLPSAMHWSIVGGLSLAVLWIAARIWNENEFEISFCTAVIATILTGVHGFVYDLSLLLLPIAIAIGELAKRNELLRDLPLNIALIVLFIPPVHHVLIVWHVYALMSLVLLVIFERLARLAAGKVAN
jgi:hypothetical protein